jgi:two-component system OmpR family sensor kinase
MIAGIVFLISLFYYQSQEKLMFSNKRATLSTYAYEHIKRLKSLHHFFPEQVTYPRDIRYKSAIYDIEKQKIFSELNSTSIQFDNEIYHTGDKMHYMKSLDEYYLGAKYLFLEVPYDETWKAEAWKTIATFGISLSLFFMLIGLFLAKLFVRPMKESIELLDMFIKDTTHELNTPLSSILANIEMIDKDGISDENKRKINRIEMAAKTVSVLYNDLTYLTFRK